MNIFADFFLHSECLQVLTNSPGLESHTTESIQVPFDDKTSE